MKLRYYMRGLGIGIIVTAILMGVTLNGKTEKLSDAEIIERAEALGMEQKYESTVLADTVEDDAAEKVTEDGAVDAEEEQQPQEIITDVSENSAEEETAEEVTDSEVAEMIQITVVGGDGSGTVARKLAQAGLVEDAQAYDRYLCSNGYDKRICTGTHSIPAGASEEEIAEIITSRP